MDLYAGIDAGQSSTHAVIGDANGCVLGRGRAGPADEVGQDAASTRLRDALNEAVANALAQAKLPSDLQFAQIVAGVSGYEGRVYGQAPDLRARGLMLEHDAPVAHAGAFAGEAGVVVIAGTGSVAYAVNENGASALAGGWGYLFGDEGSAFWFARQAICDAMRESDAGVPSDLEPALLEHFGVPSLRKLARGFYAGRISRADVAAFASVLVRRAEDCSEKAAHYVKEGTGALVMLAMRAMEQVALQSPKIAFVGGLLESPTVRSQIAQWMQELLPSAKLVQPRYDPAAGALLLAYRAGGVPVREIQE